MDESTDYRNHELPFREPPFHWLVITFSWIWILVALPFITDATVDPFIFLALTLSGLTLAVCWIVVTLLNSKVRHRPLLKWWLTTPLVGLFAIIMLYDHVGFRLRVQLSEPRLRGFVERTLESRQETMPSRWVGLFHVHRIEAKDGKVYLYTARGFLDEFGIAYLPRGETAKPGIHAKPLFGDWHWFRWKF